MAVGIRIGDVGQPDDILVSFKIAFIYGVQCLFYQKPIISYQENADLQQPCLHNLNIISSAAIIQEPFPF